MKTYGISGVNFMSRGIIVKASENKTNPYLYNHVLAITNELKVPATFKTNEINLPTIAKNVQKKLKDLSIKYEID